MSDKLAYHAKKMNAINKSKDSFYRSFGSEICEIAEALYDTILRLQLLETGGPCDYCKHGSDCEIGQYCPEYCPVERRGEQE